MSSHHIVRDAQEPALLIWEPGCLSYSQAGPLLEWSPRVLVHEQALPEVISWGIKIDAVLAGRQHSAEIESLLSEQGNLSFIPAESSALSFDSLFEWLKKHRHQEVNLCLRPTAEKLKLLESYLPSIQLQLLADGWRYHYLCKPFEKWVPAGQRLQVFPEQAKVVVQGLRPSGSGSYQATAEGFVQIHPTAPCWIAWPLE